MDKGNEPNIKDSDLLPSGDHFFFLKSLDKLNNRYPLFFNSI